MLLHLLQKMPYKVFKYRGIIYIFPNKSMFKKTKMLYHQTQNSFLLCTWGISYHLNKHALWRIVSGRFFLLSELRKQCYTALYVYSATVDICRIINTFLFSALVLQYVPIKLNLLNNLFAFKNKFKDVMPHKSTRVDSVLSQSQFKTIFQTQWRNLILLMECQRGAPNLIWGGIGKYIFKFSHTSNPIWSWQKYTINWESYSKLLPSCVLTLSSSEEVDRLFSSRKCCLAPLPLEDIKQYG